MKADRIVRDDNKFFTSVTETNTQMGDAYSRNSHSAPVITPRIVTGLGVLALLVTCYLLVTSTAAEMVLPERVLEILLVGLPALGLLCAGYWLQTGDYTPAEHWQIGTYAVGATLVAASSTVLAIALFSAPELEMQAIFFLLVSTGTEGALLGVLVGAFAVSDTLRRRGNDLQQEADRFQYLERTANIGYWEIDPRADAPHRVVHSEGLRWLHDDPSEEPFEVQAGIAECHPEDRPRVEAAVERALADGEPFDIEARLDCANGGYRWVRTVAEPVTDGGTVVKVRGVMQDITDRKEPEERLKQQNERLEQFASVVSHDLRNPLNVAQGRLELAREECSTPHLTHATNALERMEALIEDLLTLAREGKAVSDTEPVALGALCAACWENVETGDATLRTPIGRSIRADRSRLAQLLENLIRNAVEHGGDSVTVTVGELADGFYVEDDGPGIPEAERDDVFETGYTTNQDGTGFGLAIVTEIADAHDWTVDVTDSPTGGARFEITTTATAPRDPQTTTDADIDQKTPADDD